MADERPNPLGNAASHAGTAWSGVAGLIGALVTFGTLTSAQGDAINAAGAALSPTIIALGTVLAGVIPLIGGIVASFRTAAAARDHVTPVSDPMVAVGGDIALVGFIGNIAGAVKVGIVGHRNFVEKSVLQKYAVTLLK